MVENGSGVIVAGKEQACVPGFVVFFRLELFGGGIVEVLSWSANNSRQRTNDFPFTTQTAGPNSASVHLGDLSELVLQNEAEKSEKDSLSARRHRPPLLVPSFYGALGIRRRDSFMPAPGARDNSADVGNRYARNAAVTSRAWIGGMKIDCH